MTLATPTSDHDPLETLGAGFGDPVHEAQQVFRALLTAMSLPGRVLAPTLPAGLCPPAGGDGRPWDPVTAALALTLLDAQCPVHLVGPLDSAASRAWLRFHTGASVAALETAALGFARAATLDGEHLARVAMGHDDTPQDGATLFVEVDDLEELPDTPVAGPGAVLLLQGPGIPVARRLRVAGVPPGLWRWRQGLEAAYPRGVDLVLCQGRRLAALPRSTRLTLETPEA
jgi:alpha-D-ribose 1-methylphosphonate 5-triphosphate synthase subunit PhnH